MKLKDKIEIVIQELELEAAESEELERKRTALEHSYTGNNELRKRLEERTIKIENREKQADYERDLLTKKEIELKAKAITSQELLQQIERDKHELTQKRDELTDKIKEFETAEKTFKELDHKREAIEFAEQMIEREKGIDRERKKILDLREEKIAKRERQLQIEDAAI